jgi:hypothetical protein
MAVHDIRESIENSRIVVQDSLTIVQKKVELKRGMRHEVLACDIFQDAVLNIEGGLPCYIEFFVTPYPVIYSNMNIAVFTPNRGPVAASDSILFKANMFVDNSPFPTIKQYPSPQISAGPSFSFYTPFVYFTMFVHNQDGEAPFVDNVAFSFLLRVNSTKATNTSYGLGLIRERSVAQGINLMNQGRTIPKAANVGQIFPQWKYGGIRPERMIDGTAARNFWLNYSADSSEKMLNTGNVRLYLKNARTMQDYESAFGADSATLGPVPDWIRFGLNRGLVSGPIRAQQPPRKLADNGNTLML